MKQVMENEFEIIRRAKAAWKIVEAACKRKGCAKVEGNVTCPDERCADPVLIRLRILCSLIMNGTVALSEEALWGWRRE